MVSCTSQVALMSAGGGLDLQLYMCLKLTCRNKTCRGLNTATSSGRRPIVDVDWECVIGSGCIQILELVTGFNGMLHVLQQHLTLTSGI